MGGQRSAWWDCLHFRSRTSSSKDVERANALARGGLSARSTAFSGSASELDEQCSWMSRSASKDSDANLSLFVDVSARALGSSSVFFLLNFLCLTVPLSDFPLGSSVKPRSSFRVRVAISLISMRDRESECVAEMRGVDGTMAGAGAVSTLLTRGDLRGLSMLRPTKLHRGILKMCLHAASPGRKKTQGMEKGERRGGKSGKQRKTWGHETRNKKGQQWEWT